MIFVLYWKCLLWIGGILDKKISQILEHYMSLMKRKKNLQRHNLRKKCKEKLNLGTEIEKMYIFERVVKIYSLRERNIST